MHRQPQQAGVVEGLDVAAWALAAVVATQRELATSTATRALAADRERALVLAAAARPPAEARTGQ